MQINEHEFCLRCGRRLKNAQARERGYGAVCFVKLKSESGSPLFVPQEHKSDGDTLLAEKR